jgi:hypothetical protein
MSSTPSDQPALKITVTVVEPSVHPVDTSCIAPVVMPCVTGGFTPSESVSVPFAVVYTLTLFKILGLREKLNEQEVPDEEAKYTLLVGSAP